MILRHWWSILEHISCSKEDYQKSKMDDIMRTRYIPNPWKSNIYGVNVLRYKYKHTDSVVERERVILHLPFSGITGMKATLTWYKHSTPLLALSILGNKERKFPKKQELMSGGLLPRSIEQFSRAKDSIPYTWEPGLFRTTNIWYVMITSWVHSQKLFGRSHGYCVLSSEYRVRTGFLP